MKISVSEAKAQLTELVRRAEAGEEIMLTRHGQVVAQVSAVREKLDRAARRAAIELLQAQARAKANPGPSAARSQDFLYDADGLPV